MQNNLIWSGVKVSRTQCKTTSKKIRESKFVEVYPSPPCMGTLLPVLASRSLFLLKRERKKMTSPAILFFIRVHVRINKDIVQNYWQISPFFKYTLLQLYCCCSSYLKPFSCFPSDCLSSTNTSSILSSNFHLLLFVPPHFLSSKFSLSSFTQRLNTSSSFPLFWSN